MNIAVASDHGGLQLKNIIVKYLKENGYQVTDFGTQNEESVDYPDFAGKAAKAVAKGQCDKGIVICGTGIGVSITANKVKGIRCALVHDCFSAKATAQHNDTNMLAMGQRVIGEGLALDIVDTWLTTTYEGGRHDLRIQKMMAYEEEL
jgi:ribose 5-phosphate isomerase B